MVERKPLYPVFLNLSNHLVVIVGGGSVAGRKVKGLLDTGCEIRVVAPEAIDRISEWARKHWIEWIRREFHPEDIRGARLVFAATDHPVVNARVCQACDLAGILVNRVESPEASDFVVPSVLRRGDLCMAVSSGGASPRLTRLICNQLEEAYGPEYAPYVRMLEKARLHILKQIPDADLRSKILCALAEDTEILAAIRNEDEESAWKRIRAYWQPGVDE